MKDIKILSNSSDSEVNKRNVFFNEMFKKNPIPDNELLNNLGLYINRQTLSIILYMHRLYRKIINVHGEIIEFGTRWGQNLALFESFRGIYEPYNYNRKIIGFDTFTGFPEVHSKDGNNVSKSGYSVSDDYESYLNKRLNYHKSESPLNHIQKYEIVKGDATKTIYDYLDKHPETIVALAYFDFDIYLPTKECLEAIKDRLTKGSILAFDELSCSNFPGETLAFKEVFELDRFAIKRSPLTPLCSYVVIG